MATPANLPLYHPQTPIRRWEGGVEFRLSDALTGVVVLGATGSGKTSGPAKNVALGYLAANFGGLVLCAKSEERRQWEEWARATNREKDLVIVDGSGKWRFNFLDHERERSGDGAGMTINIVALLDEISQAIAGGAGQSEGGGDNKFFMDALHHMNTNLVDLAMLAGAGISLPLLRAIVVSAPQTLAEAASAQWQSNSDCAKALKLAHAAVENADADTQADYEECRNYWLKEFPALSERTRSIITLSFSIMARPLISRPLRRLFSEDTNIRPEDTFAGKIIIVDLSVQEYRLAGRIANLVWKYCFQVATLRRSPPVDGSFLRPVFFWADEFQNFVSSYDFMFVSVCRSAGACMSVMVQNRESLLSVLGKGSEATVDSLLANLQAKFFCQNSGPTNEWASKLIGEHWENIIGITSGRSAPTAGTAGTASSGINVSRERSPYVETVRFATLRRGGANADFKVETIVYLGGHLFEGNLPYKLVTYRQR